ncbi:VOC family protein [Amycolatopsis samaneae]|uniref:VOC family protein n=1 Tax=Amycolatopsis samaneae TaxID=664691 RepID=A0ABW5GQB7_9PSEU
MTANLVAVCFAAGEPLRLARFWAGVLGGELTGGGRDVVVLVPRGETGFGVRFVSGSGPKLGQNQMHFDLTSVSPADQRATVAKSLGLGARHIDIGQRPEEGHVVLADPEGNEFCVIEPGNAFLEGCGFLGAVACDGSREVGLFWRAALGWPLVWDQDEETAIQAPGGGPKITWGGSPVNARAGKNRLRFELSPGAGRDQEGEVERLVALGAGRVEGDRGVAGPVVLADPDGNEFCVLAEGVAGS